MAARKTNASPSPFPLPPPATTIEGREAQLITAAMNLVERRIHEGTASAQETVHFLKLGSTRNQLEQDRLKSEISVLETRVKEMENRSNSEALLEKALQAFRGYRPSEDGDEIDPYLQ